MDPDISAADLLQQQDMIIEVAFFGKKNAKTQEFSDRFCCSPFEGWKAGGEFGGAAGRGVLLQGEGRLTLLTSPLCF